MDVDTADNNSDNESEQYTNLCVECDYDAQDFYELKTHKLSKHAGGLVTLQPQIKVYWHSSTQTHLNLEVTK